MKIKRYGQRTLGIETIDGLGRVVTFGCTVNPAICGRLLVENGLFVTRGFCRRGGKNRQLLPLCGAFSDSEASGGSFFDERGRRR